MKKILSIIFVSLLFGSTAYAGGMVGIKAGWGELDATKKGYTAGSNAYGGQSKAEDSEFGAIFAEVELPDISGLSIGVEYIPFSATISVDGNSSDSHATLGEHTTIYGLFTLGDTGAYVKAGYAMADIDNVKANYTTTTINSHDDSLDGPMIGIGFQKELISSVMGRIEATFTEYDDVSVTTTSNGSASVKKTADAELTTLTISVAKQF